MRRTVAGVESWKSLAASAPRIVRSSRRNSLAFPYLPMKEEAWEHAKELAWRLQDKSCNPPWNDMLIASLALGAECRVYRIVRHFEQMHAGGAGIMFYLPGQRGRYNPD